MITRENVDRLVEWKPGVYPVTSVYLDTDPRRHTGSEYAKVLEGLFAAKRAELLQSDLTRDQQRWVQEDFARVQDFVSHQFRNDGKAGLAAFSCSASGLWQTVSLPRSMPTQVVVDERPYALPLLILVDQFDRFCAVTVDQRHGSLFEIFMGEIREILDIVDDVPKRTRKTGHLLKAETSVMHSVTEQWRVHYKNVADQTLAAFRRNRFDWLVVGGPAGDLSEFEKTLHSSLQQKLAGRISVQGRLDSTPAEILKQVHEIELRISRDRQAKLVDSLLTQAHSAKLGVVGLSETLKALRCGQVHTIVVRDGLRSEGVSCPSCRFLGVGERECPNCVTSTRLAPDVVEAAIAEATQQGCEVRHVFDSNALDAVGSIGALLRYRT